MQKMKILLLGTIMLAVTGIYGQTISDAGFKQLQTQEDTLKVLCKQMIFDENPSKRFEADSAFTRALVRALRIPNSFDYTFDSVITVSKIYAPDSSFRIFIVRPASFNLNFHYFRKKN